MLKSARRSKASLAGVALAAGVAAAAVAQPTVQEVIVTGRAGPDVPVLSEPVSYQDLDLTTVQGRTTLHERVQAAAADVCRRLREGNMTSSAVLPSCENHAVDSARDQERLAAAQATSSAGRGSAPAGN